MDNQAQRQQGASEAGAESAQNTPSDRVRPLVSVIAPMYNEERFVAPFMQSMLAQTYPHDRLEILLVDGGSTDGTRDRIAEHVARDPRIRLIDNPGKTEPKAVNLGLRHARGEIILRMDGHVGFSASFVSQNVELLERTGAECVGGCTVTVPGADTAAGRAIAAAYTSRFGVGSALSRVAERDPAQMEEREGDETTFGCWRRDLFDRLGYFDERLARNTDTEFFCRIRNRGGRIIVSPKILIQYFSRPTFRGLAKQAFGNGLWGPYMVHLTGTLMKPRHLVPLGFILALLGLGVLSFFWWPALVLGSAIVLVYLSVGTVMAIRVAPRFDANPVLVLWGFMTMHFPYGVGSLWGIMSAPFKFGFRPRAAGSPPAGESR